MKWSKEETVKTIEMVRKGLGEGKIAQVLGRTYDSVRSKIQALKREGIIKLEEGVPERIIEIPELEVKKDVIVEAGEKFVKMLSEVDLRIQKQDLLVKYGRNRKEQSSILDISDIHIGMINRVFDPISTKEKITYNHQIFLKELSVLKEAVFRIHQLQAKAYNLKTLHLNILGDIVTNDRIFSGQGFHIEGCVGEQIWKAIAHLTALIESFKAIYEKVEVSCVVGNHGRSTQDYQDEPVENNFEYHLYKVIQLVFEKDLRVKVNVPKTRDHIINIDGWRHLITHGDSFRGSSPGYINKQIRELALNLGEFDVLHMAHFHKLAELDIGGKILVKRNGCWIESDNYALRRFKQVSTPRQWFFGCSKKRKETWNYKINLKG